MSEEDLRAEGKHAAIPKVTALRKKALRRRLIGLLDKLLDRIAARRIVKRRANANVPVTGLRSCRRNPERRNVTSGCRSSRRFYRFPEGILVTNKVVGGQEQNDPIFVATLH